MDQIYGCESGDLHAINTQDLLTFAEAEHTLSDINHILSSELPQEDQKQPEMVICQFPIYCNPDHWNKFPTLDPVETNFKFDIHIEPGEKINWMHSTKLDKVYIKLNSVMNINLSYAFANPNTALFVRAMIVFSSPDEMHLAVSRCPNHRIQRDPRVVAQENEVPAFHILKCCHPSTFYTGEENQQAFGNRASLVVPLDPNVRPNDCGRVSQSLGLEFLCQNSCSNGIQRKQTVLVFTLEDSSRQILGKRIMHFKVCSCPKRDMIKEHTTNPPTRKREATAPPTGKQPSKLLCMRPGHLQTIVKSEPATPSPPLSSSGEDVSPLSLPSLDSQRFVPMSEVDAGMCGPDVAQLSQQMVQLDLTIPRSSVVHVLRCAYGDVTSQMANDRMNTEKYIQCARDIKRQIEFFSQDSNNFQ